MIILIDVVDRIPTNPGVYRLTDLGSGLVKLERADEPIEEGTPINRALFLSIQYDLAEKIVRFSQAQPTIAKGATHTTTIWLSDSHLERWNCIDLTQKASGVYHALGSHYININRELGCYQRADYPGVGYTDAYRPYPEEMSVVGGVGTITREIETGGVNSITYEIQIIFDGYKIEVKQKYVSGSPNDIDGEWFDVAVICRGRVE